MGPLQITGRATRQVTAETAHYPRVKDSLRTNVHEPRQPWAIVKDRHQQGSPIEDSAQFEAAIAAGSREYASVNRKHLSVGTAQLGNPLKKQ
jgi:hypothetical protein